MGECTKSKVIFNTSTLEKLVSEPEVILNNWENFWEEERPHKLTKLWAEGVNYTMDKWFDRWTAKFREWAELTPDERQNHSFMELSRSIIGARDAFLSKALPHLCSYLPPDADLNVTVHLTSFVPTTAFAWQDIVVNIGAENWNNNPDNILNLIIHEIFHAGFSFCRDLRTEEPLENELVYKILDNLQSEAICTYVGYKAQHLYPAPDDKDYPLINNYSEVQRLIKELNFVLSQVNQLPEEELQKLAWDKCVIGRAYYVVGAFMYKLIEEKKGLQTLISTLTTGPLSFINEYNLLATEGQKIVLP